MYVTEDTTRADPDTLRALYSTAIRAGAKRVCVADTVGHATPHGAAAVVRFIKSVVEECGGGVGIDWHGHRDRDFAVINTLAALDAGATRLHGAAIGIGERVGNTPMELLLMNLVLMGYIERDLSALCEYCDVVAAATDVPIPANYPVVGRDAFRTATGVHAAAVIKAFRKNDLALIDAVYSGVPGQPDRPRAADRRRPDVGQVERRLLARAARLSRRPTRRSSIASSPGPRHHPPCSPTKRSSSKYPNEISIPRVPSRADSRAPACRGRRADDHRHR